MYVHLLPPLTHLFSLNTCHILHVSPHLVLRTHPDHPCIHALHPFHTLHNTCPPP
jgi:hypothetical protein